MEKTVTTSKKTFPHFFSIAEVNPLKTSLLREGDICYSIRNDFFYSEYYFCPLINETKTVETLKTEGFYFSCCWEGCLSISANGQNQKKIMPFQSAIVFDKCARGIELGFTSNSNAKFCIIGFNKPEHLGEAEYHYYFKFKEAFCQNIFQGNNIFIGKPNLKLLDQIRKLSHITKKNVASELIIQGLIFEILGLKMEQLLQAVSIPKIDTGILDSEEMAQIYRISSLIRENPSFDYSINYLCNETRLSPSKLQEGFKKMHNRTVISFIRHVRLEKAVELITSTDMNISEIVYSIGLTSRSYFSKIFKNKYNCCPKYFQEQNKSINAIT